VSAGEERAILEAIAHSLTLLPTHPGYAQLREHLRGHPLERRMDALAAELIGTELDEESLDLEFAATLERLQTKGVHKMAFDALQAKARQFDTAGMSVEEKEAYRALFAQKKE
jgi:hypothetical protein